MESHTSSAHDNAPQLPRPEHGRDNAHFQNQTLEECKQKNVVSFELLFISAMVLTLFESHQFQYQCLSTQVSKNPCPAGCPFLVTSCRSAQVFFRLRRTSDPVPSATGVVHRRFALLMRTLGVLVSKKGNQENNFTNIFNLQDLFCAPESFFQLFFGKGRYSHRVPQQQMFPNKGTCSSLWRHSPNKASVTFQMGRVDRKSHPEVDEH